MEKKIRQFIFSPFKKNQQLGWFLDQTQNQGKIKQALEKEYIDLLEQSIDGTIEELLQTERVVYRQPTAKNIRVRKLPNVNSLSCQKHPQLQEFHIADCPNLEHLHCCNNPQLTKLTIYNCPKLLYLSCVNNQLIECDLQETPELVHFYATSNQLTTFDVSNYPKLFGLDFTQNPMKQLTITSQQQEKLKPNIAQYTQLIIV